MGGLTAAAKGENTNKNDVFDPGEDTDIETNGAAVRAKLGTKHVGVNRYYYPGCCACAVITNFPRWIPAEEADIYLAEIRKNIEYLLKQDRDNMEYFLIYFITFTDSQMKTPGLRELMEDLGFRLTISNAFNYSESIYHWQLVNPHSDGRQDKAGEVHKVEESVPFVLPENKHGLTKGHRAPGYRERGRGFPY